MIARGFFSNKNFENYNVLTIQFMFLKTENKK